MSRAEFRGLLCSTSTVRIFTYLHFMKQQLLNKKYCLLRLRSSLFVLLYNRKLFRKMIWNWKLFKGICMNTNERLKCETQSKICDIKVYNFTRYCHLTTNQISLVFINCNYPVYTDSFLQVWLGEISPSP